MTDLFELRIWLRLSVSRYKKYFSSTAAADMTIFRRGYPASQSLALPLSRFADGHAHSACHCE